MTSFVIWELINTYRLIIMSFIENYAKNTIETYFWLSD